MCEMLKIGSAITIDDYTDSGLKQYKSKIMDIIDNQIFIDYPVDVSTGKIVYLIDFRQFVVHFISQNQSYTFQTELMGRTINKIPLLIMKLPNENEIFKKQRREYVRVETSVDVAIHPINNDFQAFTSVTYDLSAGGTAIALKNDKVLRKNMMIEIWISLPIVRNRESTFVTIKAKVLSDPKEQNDGTFILPIEFIDVSEIERQIIMRYIFEQQLAQRQKEMTVFEK